MENESSSGKAVYKYKLIGGIRIMYATAFEFNGIRSDDIGLSILNFDGFSNDGVGTAGSEITFNTSKPANNSKWNFHNPQTETPLQMSFQIGKSVGNGLSREECAFLMRWLVRSDGYHYLRFLQDEYENTYFHCQITLQWIRHAGGQIVGAELAVTCDAPYGYSSLKKYEVDVDEHSPDSSSFQIYNDSDETGAILFDSVDIICTSDADVLTITNDMDPLYSPTDPYITRILNCVAGEQIHMANHQIMAGLTPEAMENNVELNHTSGTIADDFNFHYPRLIHISGITATDGEEETFSNPYTENRINTYTVTGGSCHLCFTYRTIRKVLP